MTDFNITLHENYLSVIAMAESLKFTPRTKHIAIKYHHFRSWVNTSFNKSGDIKLKYISTKMQLADKFTKPFNADSFFTLRKMVSGWLLYQLHFVSKGVWECKLTAAIQVFIFGFKLLKLIFIKLTIQTNNEFTQR